MSISAMPPLIGTTTRFSFFLLGPLIAGVLGVLLASLEVGEKTIVLILIGAAIFVPLGVKIASRRLDILEPFSWASAAFILLFFIKPVYDVSRGELKFVAVDVTDTFTTALLAVLVAITSFHLGYFAPWGRALAGKLPRLPESSYADTKAAAGVVLVVACVALIAARPLFPNVAFVSEAAKVGIPGVFLLYSIQAKWAFEARVLAAVAFLLFAYPALLNGDRREFLAIACGVLAYTYLQANKRPRFPMAVVVGLATFFLLIIPIRESRASELNYAGALIEGVTSPLESAESVLSTTDSAMVNALAIEVASVGTGKAFDWHYGLSTLSETILQPIPQEFWQGKPETIRNEIIQDRWGMVGGSCVNLCPTFSAVGTFYADAGFISVALGSLALGLVFRLWYEYFLLGKQNTAVQISYSATIFLPFYIWWAGLSPIAIFVSLILLPLWLALVLAKKVAGPAKANRPGWAKGGG